MKQILFYACALIIGFSSCTEKTNTMENDNAKAEYYGGSDNELKIIAEIQIKPDASGAMKPIFEKVIAGSQAEEGNIYYDLHLDITDTTNTKYMMVEVWKDQAAIDFHNSTPHYKNFKKVANDYIENLRVTTVKVAK